jgi:hypothetical protein
VGYYSNLQTPGKAKSNDTKDSFYEELECVFDQFPTFHMKMLIGNLKIRKKVLSQTKNQEFVSHDVSNDNGIKQ